MASCGQIGRLGWAAIKKETTWGTLVAGDFALRLTSESLASKPDLIEDPSLIATSYTSDMVKAGESVSGNIEKLAHVNEWGPCMYWTLGGESAVADAVQGWLFVWYTGSSNYARMLKSTNTLTASLSPTSTTYTADTNFNTTGSIDLSQATSDTLSELVTLINTFTGWKAAYGGYSAAACSTLADFTATSVKSNGVTNALVKPFKYSSTYGKMHTITPVSTGTCLPSYSMTVGRTLGTNKAIGYSGLKVNTCGITIPAKESIKLSIALTGKSETIDQTDITNVYSTTESYIGGKAKVYLGNGTEGTWVKDLNININNNLDTNTVVGSYYIEEQMKQSGSIEITGNFNLDTTSTTGSYQFATQYRANTSIEMILYLEGSNYVDSTNHILYSTVIRIPNVRIIDFNPVLSGPDRITVAFSGKALNSTLPATIAMYITDNDIDTY